VFEEFRAYTRAARMPTRPPPRGNLTAALALAAGFELIVNRLLGHLFTVPTCHTALGCLALRFGPFLLYLTGLLALVVVTGGVAGHLWRGELFPRGMRFTVAALTLVFVLLLAASLFFGRVPPRYETHLKTSFGFVAGMVALAFLVSGAAPLRARLGLVLFALPPLLHVAAFVAAQATWWRDGWVGPERITLLGEVALVLAAAASPLLLLRGPLKLNRTAPGLAMAAGLTTFFFVASLGRPDLMQALALYGLHLDLPRVWSPLGVGYTLALLGFTVTLASLLLGSSTARLAGFGLALIALGGYQTASPVELALTLTGLVALATGLARQASSLPEDRRASSPAELRSLLASIGEQIADASHGHGGSAAPIVEVDPGEGPEENRGTLRTVRRGRPVALVARRAGRGLDDLKVVVGAPPANTAPDATIESHETWLARRPETRPAGTRIKTDDPAFDRKWGVYGQAPLGDRSLRKRVLAQREGTIKLWSGVAAELVVSARLTSGENGSSRGRDPLGAVIETIDLLEDLVEASEPPPAPAPSHEPATSN